MEHKGKYLSYIINAFMWILSIWNWLIRNIHLENLFDEYNHQKLEFIFCLWGQ